MNSLSAILADVRGYQPPPAPWERKQMVTEGDPLSPPRHLSERRRVELALPALIAHRIVALLSPEDGGEAGFLKAFSTVFWETAIEGMDDLRIPERKPVMDRALSVRRRLLDPYAEKRRGGPTVIRAFAFWLQDHLDSGALVCAPDGFFMQAWDALAESIQGHEGNVEDLNRAARSARKMANEWHAWLRREGYYTDSVTEAA